MIVFFNQGGVVGSVISWLSTSQCISVKTVGNTVYDIAIPLYEVVGVDDQVFGAFLNDPVFVDSCCRKVSSSGKIKVRVVEDLFARKV